MAKNKVKDERKDILTDEDFKPENIKVNITIRLTGDILDAYRAEAKKLGIGYQTLMQMKLREAIGNTLEQRLAKVESELAAQKGKAG